MKTMGPFDSLEPALKEFDKKFKDKSGHKWEDRGEPAKKGKYTFIERSYEDDSDDEKPTTKKEEEVDTEEEERIQSKLPVQTQRLIELIFNQNHFNAVLEGIGYNADKLPLGKLSKNTLKKGFEYLQELASLIKHPKLAGDKHGMSQKEVRRLYRGSISRKPTCSRVKPNRSIDRSSVGDRRLLKQILLDHSSRIRQKSSSPDR